MRTVRNQRGITLISWVAILIVVGFVVLFAVRVVPAYFNYWTLLNVVQGVQGDPALQDAPRDEVRSKLNTRMRINDVDDIGYDAVSIRQAPSGGLTLVIDYEVREPLVGNIDVVVSFERSVGS